MLAGLAWLASVCQRITKRDAARQPNTRPSLSHPESPVFSIRLPAFSRVSIIRARVQTIISIDSRNSFVPIVQAFQARDARRHILK